MEDIPENLTIPYSIRLIQNTRRLIFFLTNKLLGPKSWSYVHHRQIRVGPQNWFGILCVNCNTYGSRETPGNLTISYDKPNKKVDFWHKKKKLLGKILVPYLAFSNPGRSQKLLWGLYMLIVIVMVHMEHPRAPNYIVWHAKYESLFLTKNYFWQKSWSNVHHSQIPVSPRKLMVSVYMLIVILKAHWGYPRAPNYIL